MIREFRAFMARGNVMELAVGLVIGAAFTTVVKSFVDDLLMPPIGLLLGGVDFSELYIPLSGQRFASRAAAVEAGAPILGYGVFITNVIAFVITAFAVFLLVKSYDRLRAREAAAPPPPAEQDCPFCRSRIHAAALRCPHCTSQLGVTAA